MKALVLIVFFSLGSFTLLNGQHYSHIEYENLKTFNSSKWFAPQITIYGSSLKEGKRFGTYFFSLLNPNWGQAYGGVLYRPAEWITLNAGIGLETDSMPCRVNLGAFMAVDRFSLLQIYEYGGSGFWYNVILNYSISDTFKTGIIFKRFYGLGLNMEYAIPKTPVTLNMAPLYDFEFNCARLMILFRYGF